MSAGAFADSKYESVDDVGGIYRIKVQPETLAATIAGQANAAPAGAVNRAISAKVSKSVREIGLGASKCTLKFTGAIPDGYKGDNVSIPMLAAAFRAAATLGATGTYLGSDVEVVGRTPERVR